MNSPAVDIAAMIEDSSIGAGTVGQTIFVSREPTDPANCITTYDTGGFEPQAGIDYFRPTVQVRIRNKSYTAGYALGEQIKAGLNNSHGTIVGTARYVGIWIMSDLTHIGYDTNNNALFTVNFRIHRTPNP